MIQLDFILPAVISVLVVHAAFGSKDKLHETLSIMRQYRPVHFITSIPVIAAVGTTAYLLVMHMPFGDKNPFLWLWSVTFGSGDGAGGKNIVFSGVDQWKWYAVAFLLVLLVALPRLAKMEEETYRDGTRNWVHGIRKSVWFGLIHMIMMIPLGVALALSIGGLWFTHQYFKGGVNRSTVYHAVYNTIVVGVILTTVLFFWQ